jgi:hypothetical protein
MQHSQDWFEPLTSALEAIGGRSLGRGQPNHYAEVLEKAKLRDGEKLAALYDDKFIGQGGKTETVRDLYIVVRDPFTEQECEEFYSDVADGHNPNEDISVFVVPTSVDVRQVLVSLMTTADAA